MLTHRHDPDISKSSNEARSHIGHDPDVACVSLLDEAVQVCRRAVAVIHLIQVDARVAVVAVLVVLHYRRDPDRVSALERKHL